MMTVICIGKPAKKKKEFGEKSHRKKIVLNGLRKSFYRPILSA
jgi:hypothetical protein